MLVVFPPIFVEDTKINFVAALIYGALLISRVSIRFF